MTGALVKRKSTFEDLAEGKWTHSIKCGGERIYHYYHCSLCGYRATESLDYCPGCMAKMERWLGNDTRTENPAGVL